MPAKQSAKRTPKSLADSAMKLAAELAADDPELAEFFRDLAGPESTGTNSAELAAGQGGAEIVTPA